MTLVVGRINGTLVSIAADTLLIENGRKLPLTQGLIKSCALPSGICVSFAGSPELARKDIWKFSGQYPHNCDFADAVSYFEAASRRTDNEYLLAFSGSAKLVKITKGKRQAAVSLTQWIGDKDAFEAFRQFEGRARERVERGRAMNGVYTWNEAEGSPSSDLYSIMRQVVFGRKVESVGGLVSILSNREGNFRAPAISDVLYDWPAGVDPDEIVKPELPVVLGVSGENMEQSLNIIAPGYWGLTMIGFYFLSGKTVLLFHPRTNVVADACTVIRNVEPIEIASRLNAALGADWRWQMLIASAEAGDALHVSSESDSLKSGMRAGFKCHVNTLSNLTDPHAVPPRAMWFPGPKADGSI